MIRCIAIDDEPLALRQIKSYIERVPTLQLYATCRNADEAQTAIESGNVDLMFVDINMPDRNGLDLVRMLKNPPMIIFTTAYSEYAVDGFRLDAVDYLLKPFSFTDFKRSVEKASSLYELMRLRDKQESEPTEEQANIEDVAPEGDSISIKADYKVSIIRYADIVYIESIGEYIRLHLNNASPITTLCRLKNMESSLPADKFMRVHRSYIVNLAYVTGYGKGRVYLSDEEYVPIGINYRSSFKEYIDRKTPGGA